MWSAARKASGNEDTRISRPRVNITLTVICVALGVVGCGLKNQGPRGLPSEVEGTIATVTDDLTWERYEKIYSESSALWKRDATLEQSNEVLKKLRTQLGKVDTRTLHTATEQQNSGGPLQGHVFIVSYQTRFENGQGMETFTLIEEDGRWALARYFVNSTALR